MNSTATRPRRVDFANNPDDYQVAIMGMLGLSTKAIQAQCDFTPCQITYRLGKQRIRRTDYRDGTSDLAKTIIASVTAQKFNASTIAELRHRIERRLLLDAA